MGAVARFVVSEAGRSKSYRIGRAQFSVGGASECTVHLADPGASGVHLRISRGEKGWVLEHAGSPAEVRVNGHPTKRWFLRPGDEISIAGARIAFEGEEAPAAPAPAPATGPPVAPEGVGPRAPAAGHPGAQPAGHVRHHPPAKRGLPAAAIFGISLGAVGVGILALFLHLRSGAGREEAKAAGPGEAEEFVSTVLEKFERENLAPPSRPAARAYLKLCDEFLQRFAGHPKAGWVRKQRSTYAPVAMEWDPPILADAMFEARTNVGRHRYAAARQALEDFLRRNPAAPDAAEAKGEIATIESNARERFEDRFDRCRDELARAAFSVGETRRKLLDQAVAYLDEAEQAATGLEAALLAKVRDERERVRREFPDFAGRGR
ncbi:MAG: FHA domain-containing protein [Planctomycetes bacterium]|nr:FHA domain-containing protein [Planctomycetota bacterium]